MINTSRRQTLKRTATFYGVGQGYGRLAAAAAPDVPENPHADTAGGTVPTPETGARKLLRQKMQAVIDDDAADDPDEMDSDDSVAQARVREQTRCAAIWNCSAAKGRKNYAGHLAFNTRLTRQEAITLLERAPMEASGGSAYQAAIDAGWDKIGAPKAGVDRHGWDAAAQRALAPGAESRRQPSADDPHGWDEAVCRVAGQDTKRKH